jgi:hypothetical protein
MSVKDDGRFAFVNNKARPELEVVFWDTFWKNAPLGMKANKQRVEGAMKVSRGIGVLWQYIGPEQGVASFLEKYSHFLPVIKALLEML